MEEEKKMTAKSKIKPQIAIIIKAKHGEYVQILGDAILVDEKKEGIYLGKLGGLNLYLSEECSGQPIPMCPDCNQTMVKAKGTWVCGCIDINKPKSKVKSKEFDELAKQQEETNKLATGKNTPGFKDRTQPMNKQPVIQKIKEDK